MKDTLVVKNNMLKTRPAATFCSPTSVLAYTFLRNGNSNPQKEKDHLYLVVNSLNLNLIEDSDSYLIFQREHVQLRVEIHHEFICYIWILKQTNEIDGFIHRLPETWLSSFPDEILTQTFISFEKSTDEFHSNNTLKEVFGDYQIIGNYVENQSARIWTNFNQDNKSRLLRYHIEDITLGPRRAGRLAQNLIDIENYRNMAMIAFPIAEEITFELEEQELNLAQIIKSIAKSSDIVTEKKLLRQLLILSVVSEEWRSKSAHRFSATDAYKKIIEDRLIELEEKKVLGYQLISTFLTRATMPTFRTCEATNNRLNLYISRIDRAVSLLSTRIRISVEEQNQALLQSANTQNKQQVTLQETIETFSIVAITYYAGSLVKYLLDAIKHLGFQIDPYVWTGILLPIIFLVTLFTMRILRKRMFDTSCKINSKPPHS
jgi:uncharacterized membrane-anchored protein